MDKSFGRYYKYSSRYCYIQSEEKEISTEDLWILSLHHLCEHHWVSQRVWIIEDLVLYNWFQLLRLNHFMWSHKMLKHCLTVEKPPLKKVPRDNSSPSDRLLFSNLHFTCLFEFKDKSKISHLEIVHGKCTESTMLATAIECLTGDFVTNRMFNSLALQPISSHQA